MEKESYGELSCMEEESWRRNRGGGILEELSWRRNHGEGGRILEEESWIAWLSAHLPRLAQTCPAQLPIACIPGFLVVSPLA